jgi:hypothetical protein
MEYVTKKSAFVQAGNYMLGFLLVYFLEFGYICNIYNKGPEDNLLFIYLNFFNAQAWLSLPILIIVLTYYAFREQFLIYSVKSSIAMVPTIVILSIVWYWINYRVPFYEPFVLYFGNLNGYLNLLILFIICIFTGFLGGFLRFKYQENMKKKSLI